MLLGFAKLIAERRVIGILTDFLFASFRPFYESINGNSSFVSFSDDQNEDNQDEFYDIPEEEDEPEQDETPVYPQFRMNTIPAGSKSRWPGVEPGAASRRSYYLQAIRRVGETESKWVKIYLGGFDMSLFTDTGCGKTISAQKRKTTWKYV